MRITFKNRCPKCNVIDRKRLQRSPWMRFLKDTRLYKCMHCRTVYMVIFVKKY